MTERKALARDEDQTITITVRRWREHIANARAEALEEVKANTQARYIAELMMRDAARKNKNASIAEMHSDRAQAFNEIIRTLAQSATDGGNHDRP
jgi:ribonuclease D